MFVEQIAELVASMTGYSLEIAYGLLQRLKRKQVDYAIDGKDFTQAVEEQGGRGDIALGVFALMVEFAPEAVYRSGLESYLKPIYESAYLQVHYPEAYQAGKKERLYG